MKNVQSCVRLKLNFHASPLTIADLLLLTNCHTIASFTLFMFLIRHQRKQINYHTISEALTAVITQENISLILSRMLTSRSKRLVLISRVCASKIVRDNVSNQTTAKHFNIVSM